MFGLLLFDHCLHRLLSLSRIFGRRLVKTRKFVLELTYFLRQATIHRSQLAGIALFIAHDSVGKVLLERDDGLAGLTYGRWYVVPLVFLNQIIHVFHFIHQNLSHAIVRAHTLLLSGSKETQTLLSIRFH